MFGIAEGEHPKIYRLVSFINEFLFSDYNDLCEKNKEFLILEKPKDRDYNFLRKEQIHFFDDCLPQFYKIFIPLANKCYDYVYNNKGELTGSDIPPIDLDTGRNLASKNNLDLIPTLWSLT